MFRFGSVSWGTIANIVGLVAAFPEAIKGQQPTAPARDSLVILLPRLPLEAQEKARQYMAADSTSRRTALRPLTEVGGAEDSSHHTPALVTRDSLALRFYWIASRTDPWPVFRITAMDDLVRRSDLPPATKRLYLADFIGSDPDSSTVFAAVDLVHWLARDTTAIAALRKRVRALPPALARSWLGRAHQRAQSRYLDLTLPVFLQEAPPPLAVPVPREGMVRFFALGDWGDNNIEPQRAVSRAVRAAHARAPFAFGITLGDNFYEEGLESPRSGRWRVEYEEQYGVMGVPVFAALGNHDQQGSDSPAAEILYSGRSKTWRMPATHYTVIAGPVQLFILDAERLTPWQLGWLDSALAASRAPWKIVAGHWDMYSNRADGSSLKAQRLVPILRRHRVAAYLNGHYHTLQHYQVDGIDYITSGAGGRRTLYDVDTTRVEPARRFAAKQHGFAILEITRAVLGLQIVDSAGVVLYRYQRER